MKDIYNISAIINHAISGGYDIAPDRMEWVKLCHALKLMGYDETYFVALSQCHGTPESVARRKWREETERGSCKSDSGCLRCGEWKP